MFQRGPWINGRRTAAWTASLLVHAVGGLIAFGWCAREAAVPPLLVGDLYVQFQAQETPAGEAAPEISTAMPAVEVNIVVTPAHTDIDRQVLRPATTQVERISAAEWAHMHRLADEPRGTAKPPPRETEPIEQPSSVLPRRKMQRPLNVPGDAPRLEPPSPAQAVGHHEDTAARVVYNFPPQYPRPAVEARLKGTVLLRLTISTVGTVANVEVISSSGHTILDGAAVQAVRAWRFEPARRHGQSIATVVRLPVRFSLD